MRFGCRPGAGHPHDPSPLAEPSPERGDRREVAARVGACVHELMAEARARPCRCHPRLCADVRRHGVAASPTEAVGFGSFSAKAGAITDGAVRRLLAQLQRGFPRRCLPPGRWPVRLASRTHLNWGTAGQTTWYPNSTAALSIRRASPMWDSGSERAGLVGKASAACSNSATHSSPANLPRYAIPSRFGWARWIVLAQAWDWECGPESRA